MFISADTQTANHQALFALRNLAYEYVPGYPVLDQLNLDIWPGDALFVLGANGCGKSTLLKILAGLIAPTAGSLWAFGRELTPAVWQDARFVQAFRQRVGFVFQNSDAQLFSTTVRDELAFAPLQAGLPPQQVAQRVADTAELLGIGHLLDRPPFKLSGGEKKKVALACVLSVNPEVLFFDEPTNGLDPRTQYWLVEFLTALRQTGKTIVTATHDLNIVEDLATRVVVMSEDHTLAADSTPMKVLSDRQLLLDVNLVHERSHFHVGGSRAHG